MSKLAAHCEKVETPKMQLNIRGIEYDKCRSLLSVEVYFEKLAQTHKE